MKKIILTLQFLIIAVALWSIKNYKIINIFTEYIDFIIWVWYNYSIERLGKQNERISKVS